LSDQAEIFSKTSTRLLPGFEDPMLRSGLFFAGANRVLQGEKPAEDLEDGILTAYEATGLNLQGTELVVLSACETGMGKIANGEGVFGLRRALQEAGAQAVLMSLWAVPDRETQELMTLFYNKWLAGEDKQQALHDAEMELRATVKARYGEDRPFYWGGFVLVGSDKSHGASEIPSPTLAPKGDSTVTRTAVNGNEQAAKIIELVEPVYPPLARQARIQGTVRLHAIIGTDGRIEELEAISGHPLLIQSAIDAVRKWRYAPTSVNGQPADVETIIDVVFSLEKDYPQSP
jgi:TonB family protein